MKNWIIKLILGVEISRNNFRIGGIVASSLVLIFGYLIVGVGDFFGIIDNLLFTSNQPWYSFFLVKFSFLMIFVKIIFLSLFTTRKNLPSRFIAAFVTQFVGFIGTIILHMLSNVSQNLITDPQMKAIVIVLPYTISIVMFLVIRGIYEKEDFDLEKFFASK